MFRMIVLGVVMLLHNLLLAQEIRLDKKAAVAQVYLTPVESESLLSMNELDMETGYVLYEAEIITEAETAALELENVRDYAVVYVDGELQGTVTAHRKRLTIKTKPGKYLLQIYVEHIGRITYGPEITDNAKGLFGEITLAGVDLQHWKMTPLNVKNYPIGDLAFESRDSVQTPGFYKGTFEVNVLTNTYLDISGWGMGEVWLNKKYLGSYWEEEKQRSLFIPSEGLVRGKNEIVVFELKNNQQKVMKLSETPVFK